MTILEEQVKEWRTLHNMFQDARHMTGQRQHDYLHNEVYPRLREYTQRYATKYDHLNIPK